MLFQSASQVVKRACRLSPPFECLSKLGRIEAFLLHRKFGHIRHAIEPINPISKLTEKRNVKRLRNLKQGL